MSISSENRLGFIGRERDYENNYFSFGARNYDSETGRFLSVDPLFEAFSSITPYHYAYNSPVQFKDPSGLAPEEEKKERVLWTEVDWEGLARREEIMSHTFGLMSIGISDLARWAHNGFWLMIPPELMENAEYYGGLWDAMYNYFGNDGGGSSSVAPRKGDAQAQNGTFNFTYSMFCWNGDSFSIHNINVQVKYNLEKAASAGLSENDIKGNINGALYTMSQNFLGFFILSVLDNLNVDISYSGYEIGFSYISPKGKNFPFIGSIAMTNSSHCGGITNTYGGSLPCGEDGWIYIAFEFLTGDVPPELYRFDYDPQTDDHGQYNFDIAMGHEIFHLWEAKNCIPVPNDNSAWNFGLSIFEILNPGFITKKRK